MLPTPDDTLGAQPPLSRSDDTAKQQSVAQGSRQGRKWGVLLWAQAGRVASPHKEEHAAAAAKGGTGQRRQCDESAHERFCGWRTNGRTKTRPVENATRQLQARRKKRRAMAFRSSLAVLGVLACVARGEDMTLGPVPCSALTSDAACGSAHGCEWTHGVCGARAELELPHVLVGAAAGGAAGLYPLLTGDTGCEAAKSEGDCAAAGDCRWCVCHAVPSVCVTPDVAARLPPTVFSCGVPHAQPAGVDTA